MTSIFWLALHFLNYNEVYSKKAGSITQKTPPSTKIKIKVIVNKDMAKFCFKYNSIILSKLLI